MAVTTALDLDKKRVDSAFQQFQNLYDHLSGDVRNNIADLKAGRLLYKNAKSLTNNLVTLSDALALRNASYFKWLTNFSELLTEIAGSKDNQALANIIEVCALPPGSYRIKRNSRFSIDLNAYVGAYYGKETIQGESEFKSVYGITAPIGVSFSWGTTTRRKGNEDGGDAC